MPNGTRRYGTALLALNTNRPTDPDRGAGVTHLHLTLPAAIASEVGAAELGSRAPLDPREAARILWSVPAAAFLDGRPDSWGNVPGVALMLAGLENLRTTPQRGWPINQQRLRSLVANVAPGNLTGAALARQLEAAGTVDLLNDLVLIFKYAAVDRQRPLRTVSELYRLARALTATSGAPARRQEVVAWLTAPLVVDRALTAPSEAGPRPPALPDPREGGRGGGRPFLPPGFPRIDLASPRADEVIARLERDLSDLERLDETSALARALPDADVREPAAFARLARVVSDTRMDMPATDAELRARLSVRREALLDRLRHRESSGRARVVRMQIAGFPVVIDLAEVAARTARLRRAVATRLADSLPTSLRDRLGRLAVPLEDLTIWDELLAVETPSPSYLEPVGRSDLLLVRQITTGYRRAEIAFVENVLVGETRSREHTSRVLTREELFESIEREMEETRDLQATDRAELSREVSRVVAEDLHAEGSVQVTSRGPDQGGGLGRSVIRPIDRRGGQKRRGVRARDD